LQQSGKAYKLYVEELKESRISARDSPAFITALLEFSLASPSLFIEYKVNLACIVSSYIFQGLLFALAETKRTVIVPVPIHN
jgi:hypothetical protein